MTRDILDTLPVQRDHFILESGYHTDVWLTLDGLFVSPREIAGQVAALADLLRPHSVSAVCGPLLGGAFLAHAVAAHMGIRFYFTQRVSLNREGLFTAEYRLPREPRRQIAKERVAIVDDAISAGSSVRATDAELTSAGATTVVVGAILLLGDRAAQHFSSRGIPVIALASQSLNLWSPPDCPLCRTGVPLENPLAFKDDAISE